MAQSLDDYYLQAITDASNSLERALPIAKSMRSSLSDVIDSYVGITTVSGNMAKSYDTMLRFKSNVDALSNILTNPVVAQSTEVASTDVLINLAGFTTNSNAIQSLSQAVYSYYPLNLSSLSVIPLSLFAATSTNNNGGLQFYVPRYADTLASLVKSYAILKNILISDNILSNANELVIFNTTVSMFSTLTVLSSNVDTVSKYTVSISTDINSFFIKLATLSDYAAASRASLLSDLTNSVYSNVVTSPWHQSLVINAVKNGLRKRDMTYLEPYFGLSYVPAVDVKAYGYGLSISKTISDYKSTISKSYEYAGSVYTSAFDLYTGASNFSNTISRDSEKRLSNISTLGLSIDYYKSLFVELDGLGSWVTNLNLFAVNTQYHSNWLGIYPSEQAWVAYTISTAQSNISTIYYNALSQSNALASFFITYSNVSAYITNASLTPIFAEIDRQFSGVSTPTSIGLTQYQLNTPTTVDDAASYLSNAILLGNAVDRLYAAALDVETAIIHVLIDALDPVNSLSTVSGLILSVPKMYAIMNDIATPLLTYISTAIDDISKTNATTWQTTRNIDVIPSYYTIATIPVGGIRSMLKTYGLSLATTLVGGTGYLQDMTSTREDLASVAGYVIDQLNTVILSDLLTPDYVVSNQWTLTDYPGWDFTIQNAPVFDLLSYYPGSNSNLITVLNAAQSIAWTISGIFATVNFPSLISTANSLSANPGALNDLNSLSATYANLKYYSNQVGDMTSWYTNGYQYEQSKALAVYRQDSANISSLWYSNYFWPPPPPVYSYLSQIYTVQSKINGLVSNISFIYDITTEIGTAITNGTYAQDKLYHDEYLLSAIAVCRRTFFLLKCVEIDWKLYIEPLNGKLYSSTTVLSNVTTPSLSDTGYNLDTYNKLSNYYGKCTDSIVAMYTIFPGQINAITRNDVLSNYNAVLTLSSETLSTVTAFYSFAFNWSPYSLYSNTISAYKTSISYSDAVLAISSLSVKCAQDIVNYESSLDVSLRSIFQKFNNSLSSSKRRSVSISLNDLSFITNPGTVDDLFLPYSMNSHFILETTTVSTNIPNIAPSISSAFKVYSDYIAFMNCVQTIGSSISLIRSYALIEISNLSYVQSVLVSNGITTFTFSQAVITSNYNADNILLLDYARKALDCNSIVDVANFVNDSTINFGSSRYPYTYTTSPTDASKWLGFFQTTGLTLSSYQRNWSTNTDRSLYFFALSAGQPALVNSTWGDPFSPALLRSIQTDPDISNAQFQSYYSSLCNGHLLSEDVAAAALAGTLSAFILSYQDIQSSFRLDVSAAFKSNYVDDPNADTYIYYSTYTNLYTPPTGKQPSVWVFVDSNKQFVLSNDLFGNLPYGDTEQAMNEYFISNGFRRFLLSSNATTALSLFPTADQNKQNVYYLLNIAANYIENQANIESKYDTGYGEIYQLLSIQSNTLSYIKNTLLSEQVATLSTIGSLTTSLCNWDAYLQSLFPPEIQVGKCPSHLSTFDLTSAVSNYYIVAGRGSYSLISQPVYVTTSTDVVVYTALASRAASLSLPTADYVQYISAGQSSTNIAAQLGSLVDYVEGHNIVYSTSVSGYQYFLSYNGSELDKMIIWTNLALQVMPIYSNLSAAYNTTVSAVRTWTYRKLLPQYYGNPPAHASTYSGNGLPAGYDQYFGDTVYTLEPYPKQPVFPTNTTMNWALLLSGGVASSEIYWSITAWQETSNAFTTLCNAFTVSSVIVGGQIYATGGSIAGPIAQAGFFPVTQVIDWMTKLQPSNIADTLSSNARFLSNYYSTFSSARLNDSYNADFATISSFFPYRCLSAMDIMSQAFWTDAPEQWPFQISGGLTNWKWSSNTWPRTIAHISGFTNHSGHLYIAPPPVASRSLTFQYTTGITDTVDPYSTPYFMLMSDTTKRYGIPSGLSFVGFNYPYLNSISSNATSLNNLLTSMFTSNQFLTNTVLLSSLTSYMTPENKFLSFQGQTNTYTRNAVIDLSVTNTVTNNLNYHIVAYSTDGVTPTNTYSGVSTVDSNLIFTSISYRASTLSSLFTSNLGTTVASYLSPDPTTWYYNISLADASPIYASNVSASIVVDTLSATLSLSGQIFTAAAAGFAGYGMNTAWPYIGVMLGRAPGLRYTTTQTVSGTLSGNTLTLSQNTVLINGCTLSAQGIIPGTLILSGTNSSYQISPTQSIPITVQTPGISVNGSITGGINGRNILTLSSSATLLAGALVTGTGFTTRIEFGSGTNYTVNPPLPITPDRFNVSMTVTPPAKLLTGSLVGTTLILDSAATLLSGDVLSGAGIAANKVIVSGSGTSYVTSSNPQPLAITAVPAYKTVTGSISGTALTLSSSATLPGSSVLTGTGITVGTTIASGSGTSYVVSVSQTRSSGLITVTPVPIPVTGSIIGTTLTLSASAALSISDVLTGVGVNSGTVIVASNSSTSYTLNKSYTTGKYSGPIVFSTPHYLSNIASIPYTGVPSYASLVGNLIFDVSATDYSGGTSIKRPVTLTLCNSSTPSNVLGNISGNVLSLTSSLSLVSGSSVSGFGVIPGTTIVSGNSTSYTVTPSRTALTFDAYTTPATISVNGSISGTTLTLSSSATLPVGAVLYGGGILTGTAIASGSGTSYVVNINQAHDVPITVLTTPTPFTVSGSVQIVTPSTISSTGSITGTGLTLATPATLPVGAVLSGTGIGQGTTIASRITDTNYIVFPSQTSSFAPITITPLPYSQLVLSNATTIPTGSVLSGSGTVAGISTPTAATIFPGTFVVSGSGTTYLLSPMQLHAMNFDSITVTSNPTITTVTGHLLGNILTLTGQSPPILVEGASIIGQGIQEGTTITIANGANYTHTVTPSRSLTNISIYATPARSVTPGLVGSFVGTALTLSSSIPIPTGSTLSGLGILPNTSIVSGSGTSYVVTPNQNMNVSLTVIPYVPPSSYSYLSGMSTITGTYSNRYSSASIFAITSDSNAVLDRVKEALLQMPFSSYSTLTLSTLSYSSTPIVNLSFNISTGVYTNGEFSPPTTGSAATSVTVSLGELAPRSGSLSVNTYILSSILATAGYAQLLFPDCNVTAISAFMRLGASISWSPTVTDFSGYAFLGSPAPLANTTVLKIDQLGFNQYVSGNLSFTDQFALRNLTAAQNISTLSTLLSGMFPNLNTAYSNLSWYSPISDGRTICFDVRLPSIKVFTTISTDTVYNIFADSLAEANSLKATLSIDISAKAIWSPGNRLPGYSNYFLDGQNAGKIRPDNTAPSPQTLPPVYSYIGLSSMAAIVNNVYLTYDQFQYGLSDTSAILSNANVYDSAVSNMSAFVTETEYSANRWMNICTAIQNGRPYLISDTPDEDGTGRAFIMSVPPSIGYYWSSANSCLLDAVMQEELAIFDKRANAVYGGVSVYSPTEALPLPGVNGELFIDLLSVRHLGRPEYSYSSGFSPLDPNAAAAQDGTTFGYILSLSQTYVYNQLSAAYSLNTLSAYNALISQMSNSIVYNQLLENNRDIIAGHDAYILTKTGSTTVTVPVTGLTGVTLSTVGIGNSYSNQFTPTVKDQTGYSFSLNLLQTTVPYSKTYTSYTLSPFTSASYTSVALSPYTFASNITISSLDSNVSSPGVGISGTNWSNLQIINITDDGHQITYSISVNNILVNGTTTISTVDISTATLRVDLTSTCFSLSSYYQVAGTLNSSLTYSDVGFTGNNHAIFSYDPGELAAIAATGTGVATITTSRGIIAIKALSCISKSNLTLQTMTQSNIIPFTMSVATAISSCILNASGYIFLAQPANNVGIDFYNTTTYARIPSFTLQYGGAFTQASNAVFDRKDLIVTEETARSYLTAYPYSNAYTSSHSFSFTRLSFTNQVLSFSGGITGTTLTLSSATSISVGAVLSASGISTGTVIASGSGTTYVISPTQTLASNTRITATYSPFKDLTISSLATYNGGIGSYPGSFSNLVVKSVDYTNNIINYSLSIAGGDVLGATTVSLLDPSNATLYATLSYTSYELSSTVIAQRTTSNLILSSLFNLSSNINVSYSNLSIQYGSAATGIIGYSLSIFRTGGGTVDVYGTTNLSKTTTGSALKVNLSFTSVSITPFYPSSYTGISTDGFVASDLSALPPRPSNTWTENSRAPNLAVSGVSILSNIVGSNFQADAVSDDGGFINAHFTGNGNVFYTTTEIVQYPSNAIFSVNLSDPGHLLDLVKRMTAGYSLGWSSGAAPAVRTLTPLTVTPSYGGRLINFTARLDYAYFGDHSQTINGYLVLGAIGTTYGGVKTDYRPVYTDPAGNTIPGSVYGSSYFSFKATIPTPLLNVPNYVANRYTNAQINTIASNTIAPALNLISGSFYSAASSLSGRINYFTANTSAGNTASNVSGYLFQTICGTEQTDIFQKEQYFASNANTKTGYAPFEIDMPTVASYSYTFSMLSFTLSSLSYNISAYASHVPQRVQDTLANVYNISLATTKYTQTTFPDSLNALLSSVSIFSVSAGPLTTTNYSDYIDESTLSSLSFVYGISLGSSLVHRNTIPEFLLTKLSDRGIYQIYSFTNDSATLSLGLKFTFHLFNLQVDPVFSKGTWKTELCNLINLYYPRSLSDQAAAIAASNAMLVAKQKAEILYASGGDALGNAVGEYYSAKAAYEAATAPTLSAQNKYNSIISDISDAVYNKIPAFRRSVLLSYQAKLLSNTGSINITYSGAPNIVDITLADWSLSYANYDWVIYETLCSVSINLPNPNNYGFYNNNFPYYIGDIVAYSNNQLYTVCNVEPQSSVGAYVQNVDPGTQNTVWQEVTNALVNTYYPYNASGVITSYWPAGSIVWANGGGSNDIYSLYSNQKDVDFPVSNDNAYDQLGRPLWNLSASISALAAGLPPVPITTPHKYTLTVSHPLILDADPAKNPKKWTLIPTSDYSSKKGGFAYYSSTAKYQLGNTVIYFPKLSILPRVFQVCNVTPEGGYLSRWTEPTTIISTNFNPASFNPFPIGSDGKPMIISDEKRGGVPYADVKPGTSTTNDLPRYGTADDDLWALPMFLTYIRRKTIMRLEFPWMNMMQNLDWATYLFYGREYSNDRFAQGGYPTSIQTAGYSSLAGTGPLANVGVDTATALTNPILQFKDLTFVPLNNGLSSVSATAISAWSISLNMYSISVTLSGKELLSKTLSFSPLVNTFQTYASQIVPEIAFKTQSDAIAALGGGILTSLASISSNLYNSSAGYLYFISSSISAYGIISSTYSTFSGDIPVVYNTGIRSSIESICNTLNNLRAEASNNISIINSLSVIAGTQIQTAFNLYTPVVAAAAEYEGYLASVKYREKGVAQRSTLGIFVPASAIEDSLTVNTKLYPELCNRAKTARQAVTAASNAYKAVGITAGTIAAAATKIAQNAVLMGTLLSDAAALVKKPAPYIDWNALKIRVSKIESSTRGFGTAFDSANKLAPYQKDYRNANMDRIDIEALQNYVWSDIYNSLSADVSTIHSLQADTNDRKTNWFNGPVVQRLISASIMASPNDPIAGLAAAGLLNPIQLSNGSVHYIDFGVGLKSYPIPVTTTVFGDNAADSDALNQSILSNLAAVDYNTRQAKMLSNYWNCLLGTSAMAYLDQVRDQPRSVYSVSDRAYVGVGSLSLPTFVPNRYGNYPLMGGMIFTGFPNTIAGPTGTIVPFSLAFDYGRSAYQLKDSNALVGMLQELAFSKMSPPTYVTDSSQFRDSRFYAPANKGVAVLGKIGLGLVGMMAAGFEQIIDPMGLMSLIGPEAGMSWPTALHPLNTATLSLCQLYADAAASNSVGLSSDPLVIRLQEIEYEGKLDMWELYYSLLQQLDTINSANNGLDFTDTVPAPRTSNVDEPFSTLSFIPIPTFKVGKAYLYQPQELRTVRILPVLKTVKRFPRLPPLPPFPKAKTYPAPKIVPPMQPLKPILPDPEVPIPDLVPEEVFKFLQAKPKKPPKIEEPEIKPYSGKQAHFQNVVEYNVTAKLWLEAVNARGPGANAPQLVERANLTIRVDAATGKATVSSTNAEYADKLERALRDTDGNIPDAIALLNKKPGPGQFKADVRNQDALGAARAAALASAQAGKSPATNKGGTLGVGAIYSQDYTLSDPVNLQVSDLTQAEIDEIEAIKQKYEAANEAKLREYQDKLKLREKAYAEWRRRKAAYELEKAVAQGAFEYEQEQKRQQAEARDTEKLKAYAAEKARVDAENSDRVRKNAEIQARYQASVLEAQETNKLVTAAKKANALAQANYDEAVAKRKKLIAQQLEANSQAAANNDARNAARQALQQQITDAENKVISAQNQKDETDKNLQASRSSFGAIASNLANIVQESLAAAGIVVPSINDPALDPFTNSLINYALTQGLSIAIGNLAETAGELAVDAYRGQLVTTLREAQKSGAAAAKATISSARAALREGQLFKKVIQSFSTLVLDSANSYIRSIASGALDVPGGFRDANTLLDARLGGREAARAATTATSTATRVAAGLGHAANILGAVLGAQQMGCIPPFT